MIFKLKNRLLTLLGLVFLITYSYPAFNSKLSATTNNLLNTIEWIIWFAFAADFVWDFLASKNKVNFVKTHLLDFIAVILPLFRPLRLLRLISFGSFVIQKVAIGKSLAITMKVASSAFFLCYLAAVQITLIERNAPNANIHDFGDGAWWALSTVTTVGYGDRYPTTTEGRFIAFFLMLAGISLVGVITASVAAWFVAINDRKTSES